MNGSFAFLQKSQWFLGTIIIYDFWMRLSGNYRDWNNDCLNDDNYAGYGGVWNYVLNHVYCGHYMIDDDLNGGCAYSDNQGNTVCSDDDTLLRVYDNHNMRMESNCCIQHGSQVRKRLSESHSHQHVHLQILN
jgi:hypothetical protein